MKRIPIQEGKEEAVFPSKGRFRSDVPIIVVAVGAALFVAMTVWLFLYYLPNQKSMDQLVPIQEKVVNVWNESRQKSANLPRYLEEREKVSGQIEELEGQYYFKADQMKALFTEAFQKSDFRFVDADVSSFQDSQDGVWRFYPMDFSVSGNKDKLSEAASKWWSVVPPSIRLMEVDIKKLEIPDIVRAKFTLRAETLKSWADIPGEKSWVYRPMTLPKAGIFEGKKAKEMRRDITEKEQEIAAITSALGRVRELPPLKAHLQQILDQRAKDALLHEKEFQSFENQLRSALPKLDEKNSIRLIIKVEDISVKPQAR